LQTTGDFIKKYFTEHCNDIQITADIFFHQYKNMTQCKPSMNNNYAALIPVQSPSGELILNDLVNQQGTP
jgi:hypothetical protein